MYRCPFGRKSGESQWEPSAHTVPRADQTCAAPRDNTLPPRLLSAGGNRELMVPSSLVLRPGNELPRLFRQARPDFGSGLSSRRRLGSMSGSRGGLRRSSRGRPSGDAKSVHSAVPPKRRVRAWEWRLRASARGPDPLYGIARPEPCGDLVFALEKGGVGLVARRSHGRVIIGISSSHRRVIGFGGQNYSQTRHFVSSVLQPGAGIGCNSLHTFDTCCTCVRASNTG
jgi:hypothetical protein